MLQHSQEQVISALLLLRDLLMVGDGRELLVLIRGSSKRSVTLGDAVLEFPEFILILQLGDFTLWRLRMAKHSRKIFLDFSVKAHSVEQVI